jgi:hypothetical protein
LKGLECVCEDVRTAEKLAPHGINEFVVNLMQTHEQDADIIDPAFDLACILCESTQCIEKLVQHGLLPILLSSMQELNDDVPNLLVNGAVSLSRIAATRQYSPQLVAAGTVDLLKTFLEDNSQGELGDDENDFMLESLKAIANIASEPTVRKKVGTVTGCIILVCRRHIKNPVVLEAALRVLSVLAFEPSNLKSIVNLGGINVIMLAIAKNTRNKALMVRAIKTIDFIAMGDPSYSLLVVKCGGKTMIAKIQGAYKVRRSTFYQNINVVDTFRIFIFIDIIFPCAMCTFYIFVSKIKASADIQTAATSALTAMEAAEKRDTPDTSALLRTASARKNRRSRK